MKRVVLGLVVIAGGLGTIGCDGGGDVVGTPADTKPGVSQEDMKKMLAPINPPGSKGGAIKPPESPAPSGETPKRADDMPK